MNTDASFSEKYQVAAYAFNITGEDFVIHQYGMIKGNPRTSEEAEIMALEYAMKAVNIQPNYRGNEQVMIFTDCKGAIKKILRPESQYHKKVNNAFRRLANRKSKAHISHVRSHTGNQDIKSKMNQWCHEKAYAQLQKYISENYDGL